MRGLAAPPPAVLLGLLLSLAGLVAPAPSLAANCNTPSHQPSLSKGTVKPGKGTPSTLFVFTVDYVDSARCTPSVSLIVNGLGTFTMTPTGSGSGGRVSYRVTRNLPLGTWTYGFEATSGSGGGLVTITLTAVAPSPVVVADPPPPTPNPTPNPTPKPTPPPTPRVTLPPTPQATQAPTPKPATSILPGGSPTAAPVESAAPSPSPPPPATASPRPSGGAAAGTTGNGGHGQDGGGSLGGLGGLLALASMAVEAAEGPYLPMTSWVASCLLGLLVFALVLRRRRDSDDAHSLAYAFPIATGPGGPVEGAALVDEPVDPEAAIPRWRRPSVQAARQSRLGTATVSLPTRFTTPPRPGDDRRVVGYRLVRVGDSPDELRSAEVGRLDRGDEVEVLDSLNQWTRVRGANGIEGWVPTQTVLSSVADPSEDVQPGR